MRTPRQTHSAGTAVLITVRIFAVVALLTFDLDCSLNQCLRFLLADPCEQLQTYHAGVVISATLYTRGLATGAVEMPSMRTYSYSSASDKRTTGPYNACADPEHGGHYLQ
jgi:hypothetical protein